jgi:hypothetical protein
MPVSSATEVEFSRLVASGLGVDELGADLDFASLILLAAREAGLAIQPEHG